MRLNGYSLARYEPDDELDGIWTREQLLEMGAPVRGLRFFTRVAVRPLAPDAPSGRTRRADRASAPAAIDLGSGAYLEMAPFYRPEAPTDGWGRIELTAEEMRTSTAWTRRRETTRSPGHLLDKLPDRGRQKRPPRRRGQESWENCGEVIRFARGGAQCFPWITKEWPALPLRSVPSSQSLTPALWCHVLSALLQAPRGIPGFIVAQSGRDEKEMPHGLTPSELPSVPTERHSRVARFSATNCADRAR